MAVFADFVSTEDLSREQIDGILDLALSYEDIVRETQVSRLLAGKILATLFYEASTRTRLSTESAMRRLGGRVISVADMRGTSSGWKGESLIDTVRTVQNYADVLAIRHFEAGAGQTAAEFADVPVINCGDGTNEHPTQAMLDLLTIRRERGSIDGQTVVMVGDFRHARIRSLPYALSNYDVKLTLVSPKQLTFPREVIELVESRGMRVVETDDLRWALSDADVVYIFRIQKERFKDPEEYQRVKGSYELNRAMLEETGKDDIAVMHPMPRIDELSYDVDEYPGACYFRQSFNGVLVRMALLALLLGKATL